MAKKGETQIISLSEADGKKIVKINQCELEDELVYNFFKSNEVKKTEYDTMFKKHSTSAFSHFRRIAYSISSLRPKATWALN